MESNYYALKRNAIQEIRRLVLKEDYDLLPLENLVWKVEGRYGFGESFIRKQVQKMIKMDLIQLSQEDLISKVKKNGN